MGEKFDQTKYQNQYTKAHYDLIQICVPKDEHLKERIKPLADQENMSVSQWILRAINKYLGEQETRA